MRYVIASTVLAIALTVLARADGQQLPKATPWPDDLSGWYRGEGTDSAGEDYESIVTIRRLESTYLVVWLTGTTKTVGVGFISDGKLVVGWVTETSKGVGARGVTSYKLVPKTKVLDGTYHTLPGTGEACHERLEFLRPLAPPRKRADV